MLSSVRGENFIQPRWVCLSNRLRFMSDAAAVRHFTFIILTTKRGMS